jgi:hypothetical protein
MLKFISKKEYWKAEDDGTVALLPPAPFAWHLKSIQDAVALSWLKEYKGKDIAEIGGGDSRVLHVLAKNNCLTNIDSFEGLGKGPTTKPITSSYQIIPCLVGTFDKRLKASSFDIVFSLSVVEHVPMEQLNEFHMDCLRILKPGGLLLHLIDVYLMDTPQENKSISERVACYEKWLRNFDCTPVSQEQILAPQELRFSGKYATNPDNMMNRWNKISPSLALLRESAQSTSLLFAARKNPPMQ